VGVQDWPAIGQAMHSPLAHSCVAPQAAPLAAGFAIPVSVQTATPVPHVTCPLSQTLAGAVSVQEVPAAHALHAPLSQTPFGTAVHVIPFAAELGPVSVQTDAPVVQLVVP
jgi:hypothetical protein